MINPNKSVSSYNPGKSVIHTMAAKGGRGKMWQLFGEEMDEIIEELNNELVS